MAAAVQGIGRVAKGTLAEKMHANGRAASPPPNVGKSVKDLEAIPESEHQSTWREKNGIDPAKQVKLVKLAHMRYQHPDLDQITTFMRDFGMHVAKSTDDKIWFRGYGPDQYVYYAQRGEKKFLGGTFEVESYEELVKASKLPGAGPIEDLSDAPGGGKMITLRDPEGFPMNLMHGASSAAVGAYPDSIIPNTEIEKPRKRAFQRFKPGPAGVHKLGHYGFVTTQFEAQLEWYTKNFNLVPSDLLYVGPDDGRMIVSMFAHIDRGTDFVDHHTLFLSRGGPKGHVHHCSFEVHDFDTQLLGHKWLATKGYTSVWGVGRHVLGSQIFDYWWDTTGNMVEHYADGDLVNEETPVGYIAAGNESLAVWGPEVPQSFLA